MVLFYVLINSDNYSDQIEKDIRKILSKSVKHEFQSVYGVYDGIIKIHDKNEKVREIADKIKSLPKIHSVMVLTVSS